MNQIEIALSRGKVALVSPEDADLASVKWSYAGPGYAGRGIGSRKKRSIVWMHRVILSRILGRELRAGEETDHINRDRLDNRRCNLRVASRSQNGANCLQKIGQSGFRGVFPRRTVHGTRFQAAIWYQGKRVILGRYDDPIEAAHAYNEAAGRLHGEFAVINEI